MDTTRQTKGTFKGACPAEDASWPPIGRWFKASDSGGGAECLEVMFLDGGGANVRDSKHPDGPVLKFTDAEFTAFVGGAKNGEFDR